MVDYGLLANGLNTAALVPQVYKTLKTRSVGDMSYSWLLMSFVANVLWIVYGLRLDDGKEVIFMGGVFSLFYALMLFVKFDGARKSGKAFKLD